MNSGRRTSHVGHRRFVPVIVLAAVVFIAWPGPATAADDGPYPIWWSPVLELDSLDGVEQRLDRRLWKHSDNGFELHRRVDGRRLTAVADSCRSLLKLSAEGFEARGSNDRAIQSGLLAECRAIETLGRARPARRSFVRNFALEPDALYSMPAPPDGPSCDFMCRQLYANDNGVPWSAFETMGSVELEAENTITVIGYGWTRKLQLVGRADVNGDDVEDLMMIVGSWATQGTLDSTYFFILTRFTPDAVLKYFDPERRRCRHRTCKSNYSLPMLHPGDDLLRE